MNRTSYSYSNSTTRRFIKIGTLNYSLVPWTTHLYLELLICTLNYSLVPWTTHLYLELLIGYYLFYSWFSLKLPKRTPKFSQNCQLNFLFKSKLKNSEFNSQTIYLVFCWWTLEGRWCKLACVRPTVWWFHYLTQPSWRVRRPCKF